MCTVENTGQFYWPKLPVDDENDDDDDGRLNPWCANSIFFFLQTHILLAACKQRKPTHARTCSRKSALASDVAVLEHVCVLARNVNKPHSSKTVLFCLCCACVC